MMLIVHIPTEGNGGKPKRALASMQYYKKLAFQAPSGKFVSTPITLVGVTGDRTEPFADRVEREIARHVPETTVGLPKDAFTYCSYCANRPKFPCQTVRTLTGMDT
jgi:hypothetical protein